MTAPIWRVETRKVADLKLWDKNPRKILQENFEALKKKITERGFHAVLTIDTDNTVLSGNQRMVALQQLGIEQVDVKVPDRPLTEEERDAVGIESNVQSGFYDFDKLGNLFEPVKLQEYGVDLTKLGVEPDPKPTATEKKQKLQIVITFETEADLELSRSELDEIAGRYKAKVRRASEK